MPCLVLRSSSVDASRLCNVAVGDEFRLPANLLQVREGLQRNGLLLPLAWREMLDASGSFSNFVASDDWEEDDDVVDDDDDDDEDEEDEEEEDDDDDVDDLDDDVEEEEDVDE